MSGGSTRKGVAVRAVVRWGAGETTDEIAVEEPLEIRLDGETLATTMRTPGDDVELALGFLLAEGIISGAADVGAIAPCGRPGDEGFGNVIDVRAAPGTRLDYERVLEGRRWATTTSACGVCGRQSIAGLLERIGHVDSTARVSPELLRSAVDALRGRQHLFERTGGLHGAALLSADGVVLASAEDVGRHNAVDKAVGALVRARRLGAGAPPDGAPVLLVVSGRAGFEIVQKAAAARVAVVASVSAPSSLAVDLAERAGITLAGFVRGDSFNLYTHAARLDSVQHGA